MAIKLRDKCRNSTKTQIPKWMKVNLIVLVDFSPYSESLVNFAADWGDLLKAKLIFVHKISAYAPAMAEAEIRRKIIETEKKEAFSKLKSLVEKYFSNQENINYEVTEESLILFLPQLMDEGENNLLMLGLKGTGLLKNIFIGSTVTKVIEELNHITVSFPKISRPVPESFIIALNYKYTLNEVALDNLIQLFKSSLKQVEFISVVSTKDSEAEATDYLSKLHERFNNSIPSSFKIFKGNESFQEVKSYLEGNSSSILIVQKSSRSLTDLLFRRVFINEVVFDGSIPLIVLPS